jgi:hypothetical protein
VSEEFERQTRDWLRRQGTVGPDEIRLVAGQVAVLPPRPPNRRPLWMAAAVVLALGAVALVAPRFGAPGDSVTPSSSAAAASVSPIARPDLRDDPRLALCGQAFATPELAFEMAHGRDFARHFPAAGPVRELETDEVAFVAMLDGEMGPQPGPSGAGPEPTLAPNERNLCVVLGRDAEAGSFFLGHVDVTGFRRSIDTAVPPGPSGSPPQQGCGPISLGIAYDPYATPGTQYGWPPELALADLGTVVEDFGDVTARGYRPLRPPDPAARPLRLILVQAEVDAVALVYSPVPVAASDTNADLLAKGALVLTQRPFAGQDADFVLRVVPMDDWRVELGPYPGALVLGSPTAAGIRPFGLYWADGDREWILHGGGPARPEDLVDLARSIYC